MPYTLHDWFLDDAGTQVLVRIGDRQFWVPVAALDTYNGIHDDDWQQRVSADTWGQEHNADILASLPGVEEVKGQTDDAKGTRS